jgi:hypothetical protein
MMPITTGRYGTATTTTTRRAELARRWHWLRHCARVLRDRPRRLRPDDNGAGHAMSREWGCWTIRPAAGWRSHRWITPPTHLTRAIGRDDRDGACDWAADLLGIPH